MSAALRMQGRLALRAVAPVALVALAVAVLLRFPPTQYDFYPECPIYALLHLRCPGCGATRALAALLHGNVAEALRLNALATVMAGPASVYACICYYRYLRDSLRSDLRGPLRGEAFRWPQLPAGSLYVALAVAGGFAILRNLPLRLL